MKIVSKAPLIFCAAGLFCLMTGAKVSHASILITEVDPLGSAANTYKADWFEITNTGSDAVSLSGWSMDDSHNGASGHGATLRGVSTINPGQSVVFIENSNSDQTTDAALFARFISSWFGSTVPAGFTIGAYYGSGVGLAAIDAVNVFDSSGATIANVTFTGDGNYRPTYENAAGLNNSAISAASAIGVNGAFAAAQGAGLFNSTEIGSPGTVPEPSDIAAVGLAAAFLKIRRRHTCV